MNSADNTNLSSKKFCTCFLKWVTPICCFCVVTKTKWRFDNIEVWIVRTVSSVALRQMNIHITKKKLTDQTKDKHSHHCTISTPEISQLFKVLHFSKLVDICKLTLCNIFSHLESMTLGTQEEETDLIRWVDCH